MRRLSDVTDAVATVRTGTQLTLDGRGWTERRSVTADKERSDVDGLDTVVCVATAVTVVGAETGTIVLDPSPDQGRRAITLVPDVYVCLVRAHQVVQTAPGALPRVHPRRPLTWISGPSATSDIELNRVKGVHGPRTLEVVLVSG